MTPGVLYEPDKTMSAIQAALFLGVMLVPLALSVNFRTVVTAEPLQVTIAPAPAPPPPQADTDVAAVREQIEAARRNLEQSEVARRRQQQELAEQRKEEAQKRAEEAKKERERIEAQRRAEAEEQRRIAEAKKEKELEAKRQRELEEQRRVEELKAKQQAQEEAEQRRLEALKAKQLAARNDRIMARLIGAIQERVQRHVPSPDNIPSNIQVEIKVPLQGNGRLAGLPEILSSSGYPTFDEQAVRAIIKGAEQGFEMPDDPELRKRFDELILIIKPKQS